MIIPSSALPFGNITLFYPRTQSPSTLENDGQRGPWVVPAEGPRQSSQGWAEVMRGIFISFTRTRLERCGLIGYTPKAVLQDYLTWENNRVNQVDRISVELAKRDRARSRREWEHHYAQACWVYRGRAITPRSNA